MAKADLRSAQEPLKERFRSEPSAALITLRAEASLSDGITAAVPTHIGDVVAGLHPATGGDGLSACSGDMLLQALAACAGVTLLAVATSLNIEIRAGSVHVDGDMDFRGTLGVSRQAPVGFTDIRVAYELDTDATDEQLDTLIRLTERYCVVYQTLANSPNLSVSRRQLEGTA
ncbi:MAG TPA: OsmC family protein [Actinomycetota bacterium]|jgi:uncharacterized OsmC-like protein|nr:OsmC family protein [Actinomycetota bacterium]